jgi:hypothetical protein
MYIANETKYSKIKCTALNMYLSSLLPTHSLKQVAVPSFSAETFTSHEVFSCSNLISVKLAVIIISHNQREIT